MVKVTFLSDTGKVLASSERSVSMNFQRLHIFSRKLDVHVCFSVCMCDVQ